LGAATGRFLLYLTFLLVPIQIDRSLRSLWVTRFQKRDSLYSDCQKNIPFAEGFFATSAYAAILLIGTVL
jgi:hypothetical protein